jgi:hypothetical protein
MAFAWKEEGIYVQNYQKYIEKVLTYTQRLVRTLKRKNASFVEMSKNARKNFLLHEIEGNARVA